jgi:iron complex transport system substrate-binding protein
MRVVSLLPSATEALCLIGGGSVLVGRSHECDHPRSVLVLPTLTSPSVHLASTPSAIDAEVSDAVASGRSLYRLDADRLRSLRPDLIVTQDLCSVCSIDAGSVRAAAASVDPPARVLSLSASSFEGMFDDLATLGRAVGMEDAARKALVALRERFFRAADFVNPFVDGPRVVFLEWTQPLFVAGHWTPQLIERAGARCPLNPTRALEGAGAGAGAQMAHRVAGPSRRATAEELVAAAPDAVIISPCGVGLDAMDPHLAPLRRAAWFRDLPAVREGRVAIVDGNAMFSRPGPRLVDAFEWLVAWLNDRPTLTPPGFPWAPAAF